MLWGKPWSYPWGWLDEVLISTVELRIVNGEWYPCKQCKWFSVCVVPRPKHLRRHPRQAVRVVGKCEEFTAKNRELR